MLSTLFRSLGLGGGDDARHETETVSEIAAALKGLPPERARLLAGFAYLLGRVAFADHHVTDEERAVMEVRLAAEEDVTPEQAARLVHLAIAATSSHGAAEDYQVAREFEALASLDEKRQLLRALFTVSAQHGIATVEDTEISRIANALRLDRADVMALRLEFRDALNARRTT
ncbi:MAG: TerB family tellurite resistance protein [Acidobacteria bacterium]|nr:TerB family tellurite resistance protein [Acidobacteriota bacterium]